MTAAAATVMKVIFTFRPRYLTMVGIAAGVVKTELEDQRYGFNDADVIGKSVLWTGSAFIVPIKVDYISGFWCVSPILPFTAFLKLL